MPQTRSRDERRRLRPLAALSCASLVLALTGCVEAYRSIAGVNKNDPDPQTSVFAGNMADAEAAPYPNLASVPPSPTQVTTAAERQKLAAALVADREAASAAKAGLPTAPPSAAAAAKDGSARSAKPGFEKPRSALAATPSTAAPTPAAGVAANAAPAANPSGTMPAAPAPPETRQASNGSPLEPGASTRRRDGEPAEPRPRDSSMQMPAVRTTPEPETARPAPPKPALAAVASPAPIAPPPAAASIAPAPAPELPVLAPIPPRRFHDAFRHPRVSASDPARDLGR